MRQWGWRVRIGAKWRGEDGEKRGQKRWGSSDGDGDEEM